MTNTRTSSTSKRAAIYVRISVDRPTEVSTAVQEATARQWCDAHGYTVAGVHLDRGRSAYKRGTKRPALDAMLAAVDAGELEAIVVYKLDRFARSSRDLANMLDRLHEAGTAFVSCSEGFDGTTPMGAAMMTVAGAFAQLDSAQKSERVTASNQLNAKAGKAHRGPRAFGYGADRTTPEPREAKAIRDAVRRVLAGETVSDIARRWNAAGITTANGNAWRPHTVRRVLCADYLAGWRKTGSTRVRGDWQAIVSDDDHAAIVKALTAPARRTNGTQAAHMLTGYVRCAKCGAPMFSKGRDARRRYVCVSGHGLAGCGGTSAMAVNIEREVAGRIVSTLDTGALGGAGAAIDAQREAKAAAKRIEQLTAKRADLAQRYADDTLDMAAYQAATATVAAGIESAERDLQRASSTARLPKLPADVGGWWSTADLASRRDVLAALVETVTVSAGTGGRFDPERVAIAWKA